MLRATSLLAVGCVGLLACQSPETPVRNAFATGPVAGNAGTTERADLPALCKRPREDGVRDVFCAAQAPKIGSLLDLQAQLGLTFDEASLPPVDGPAEVPFFFGFPGHAAVLLNTSTALSGRFVSTLNPRALVLTPRATLAFNRGVQQVELLSRDRGDSRLNFYLIKFTQACNSAPQGCSPGDLYTPRIESDWTRVTIEDDEELKNTPSDCRLCHQRALDAPVFLMRELDGPWLHFFMPEGEPARAPAEASGVDILLAYYAAKGNERYAGIPWAALRSTVGNTLQNAVGSPQPLVMDGIQILNERWPAVEGKGFPDTPQPSATWYREYEAFKRGEHLALPHYDLFPSDPLKLAELTRAYTAFRAGELPAEELPDLSAVYPDDPRLRAEIGLQTEPGATPAQVLVQACGSCHNDVLDQSISRAKFNIDLVRMDRVALERAIERIQLPLDDPRHMPPREFRQVDPAGVQPLIEYLARDTRSADDDAFLRQAAQWGMAVPLSESEIRRRRTEVP